MPTASDATAGTMESACMASRAPDEDHVNSKRNSSTIVQSKWCSSASSPSFSSSRDSARSPTPTDSCILSSRLSWLRPDTQSTASSTTATTATTAPSTLAAPPSPPSSLRPSYESASSVLQYALGFCSLPELECLGLVDRELASYCEMEWKLRFQQVFGMPRYAFGCNFRKNFKLRSFFRQQILDKVRARVYLMNTRGNTACFALPKGKTLLCSRERAIIYNRCERMFDLSLRINRSIQEISALIGMVSIDEARDLLQEHLNLMASVTSLRNTLMFESELFHVFPAPVLLDANTLLRGTFRFSEPQFVQPESHLMMQVWASVDGMIYRPLAPPTLMETPSQTPGEPEPPQHSSRAGWQPHEQQPNEEANDDQHTPPRQIRQPAQQLQNQQQQDRPTTPAYNSVKLHELAGMTINIDDNTLRYKLQQANQEICVNALVSNTYLLYLFNPLGFRPLDWTFEATLRIGSGGDSASGRAQEVVLPTQREGVFLNSTSCALRVFLSYGKIPQDQHQPPENDREDHHSEEEDDDNEHAISTVQPAKSNSQRGVRGSESSEPLEIEYDGSPRSFEFELTASNRVSRERREIVNHTCWIRLDSTDTSSEEVEDSSGACCPHQRQFAVSDPTNAFERHVHLPGDALICFCFAKTLRLQYIEFAIGFEPLVHRLGICQFLKT